MFLKPSILLDSGEKSSQSTRTKKTSRKPKSSAEGDAAALRSESAPTIEAHSAPEQMLSDTGHDFVEESSEMTQVQSETTWQQGQYTAEQGHEYDSNTPVQMGYDEGDYYEGENLPAEGEQFATNQNQIVLTLSYSLMNQVRQVARMEGVFPEDILIELIAEGVTRRAFEDAQRPAPSHLMTRTGYVAPDANGNVQQPHLSHHSMQGNGNQRGNHQGHNNRRFNQNNRGNHFQGRNRQNQFKNKQRNGK